MKTETAPADKNAPQTIYLKDYQPPAFLVDHVALYFQLDPARTIVTSKLTLSRNTKSKGHSDLVLNGEDLELLSISMDGAPLDEADYELNEQYLTLRNVPDACVLEITAANKPEANTKLAGLYLSNDMFCTQCEAEGFRRITFYPDRPDVLSKFDVRIEADKTAYPILLANGNKTDEGDLNNGRHYAEWSDPHPKPAYLFALVGGDLAKTSDMFTTQSGRTVTLEVFVQPENKDKCGYTLDALKRSMKWDEEVFGREYDLDVFMIVAVDHFNFGAMENKGLNIFNSAYVLASPETATDRDYALIEGIVAHEYFHNWSGNRVTCRDWFQLCLKEGFTVFRDQEFSSDMRDRGVQRIQDVNQLWARQFPEDAGPLAHPCRPESYISIDNFYTSTVYEKGAELVRMMKTLIGPTNFRRASDLYFERHDGEAATVENFVVAMEDASGLDLTQFRLWYSDAGTPTVTATDNFENGTYTLKLQQSTAPTPGQEEKPPRQIPILMGLIGPDGEMTSSELIELTSESQTLIYSGLAHRPVASLLRGYSAPVMLNQTLSIKDRLTLIRHDKDDFNRWSTSRSFALDILKSYAGAPVIDDTEAAASSYVDTLGVILADDSLTPAFKAEMLSTPSQTDIARAMETIDPEAIHTARKKLRNMICTAHENALNTAYTKSRPEGPYSPNTDQTGRRALQNTCLGLLMAGGNKTGNALAIEQAATATNMTDEAAAVSMIALSDMPEKEAILLAFYAKWQHETLVVNKWLAWQALSPAEGALAKIQDLLSHEGFDIKTPNKVRSLIGAFAMENPLTFHRADGAGYKFFFDMIEKLDPINPQVAARLLTATESWRKLEPNRRDKLSAGLKNLAKKKDLSNNVFEMAERLVGS